MRLSKRISLAKTDAGRDVAMSGEGHEWMNEMKLKWMKWMKWMNEWMNERHEIKWNEMKWNEIKWNEINEWINEWNEMNEMNEWMKWMNEMKWNGMKWNEMN